MKRKKSGPIDVVVSMTLKKPIPQYRYLSCLTMSRIAHFAVYGIQDDYPEIVVDDMTVAFGVSKTIDIRLVIDRDFAAKHMSINGCFEPASFLGYYLSRVARKLKKANKCLNRYYRTGMFDYEFHVLSNNWREMR